MTLLFHIFGQRFNLYSYISVDLIPGALRSSSSVDDKYFSCLSTPPTTQRSPLGEILAAEKKTRLVLIGLLNCFDTLQLGLLNLQLDLSKLRQITRPVVAI